MPQAPPCSVAIVLPPGEGFTPYSAGAVALVARRHATGFDRFAPFVIGTPQDGPVFAGVEFRAARPALLPGSRTYRYAMGVARMLRRLAPSLVEVHNRPEIARHLATALHPVPVALILHNDPRFMRGARRPDKRSALLGALAGVITVSEFLRGCLLEGTALAARVALVLPNAIDLDALPAPAEDHKRDPVILFAGRVVADKGADSFVAACAAALPLLAGWRAEMIGADRFSATAPDTAFLRALRPRAAAAGIAMAGFLPHPSVQTALARAAIAVVPSRWAEPFGLAALEAMAAGAALICTRTGALAEVAGDAALYVPPDDPVALAEAIRALATDPARRAALAAAGRARARRFALPQSLAALAGMRRIMLGL